MVYDSVIPLKDLTIADIPRVGGKNASLGEMITHLAPLNIQVPQGFAVTVEAYRDFLRQNNLEGIYSILESIDVNDLTTLALKSKEIRERIKSSVFSSDLETAIQQAYRDLCQAVGDNYLSVAVRSSATAEDLPSASFAGQQETFLNIRGSQAILQAIKAVYASLFTERAIVYRMHQGYAHRETALSVGIQQMVRSDCGASGVIFTIDTESGFQEVVLITSSYGLGELLVQGSINPDEFYVYKTALRAGRPAIIRRQMGSKQHKMIYAEGDQSVMTVPVPEQERQRFSLTETELESLAKQALDIEAHYGCPMDIEWAKDGINGKLYIVQARPETVKSQLKNQTKDLLTLERYLLKAKGPVLVEGRSVGQRINQGIAKVVQSIAEMASIKPGDILVTDMTDPDWEPIMKRAGAIVTNRGGRTCHAAIIARELGIPAVVGCGDATLRISSEQPITVSCSEGDVGYVYSGALNYECKRFDLETLPDLPFKVMMTIANPERAFDFQRLPNAGVGLARLEFIINQMIGIHPKACLEFQTLPLDLQKRILMRTTGYESPTAFYVNKLAEGIATLAAAFSPKPVIVRLSDFKSNEYANLLGGNIFEPKEENPMLGFRGAARYVSPTFKGCFALECQAIRKVREQQGLTNIEIMIPFVRTPQEASDVVDLLAEQGLKRGVNGLRVIMMCEIPANALRSKEFLQYFDGFSIGSNDLTQLTLGLDRDSGLVAHHFDERDTAVKMLLSHVIEVCKERGKSIGICGQGPSDYPDFARWLMEKGIDSISLNPDSVLSTWLALAG